MLLVANDDLQALVSAAIERLGIKEAADAKDRRRVARELAVALRIVPARALTTKRTTEDEGQIRKVANWVTGANAPSFPEAMTLLLAAGVLPQDWRSRLPGAAAAPPDPTALALRGLEDAVGAMVETHESLLQDLADTRTRLARLEAVRPSASRRKAGSG